MSVFVATKLIKALKGAWSFYEFAQLLVKGTVAKEKLYAIVGSILGIDSIVSACL